MLDKDKPIGVWVSSSSSSSVITKSFASVASLKSNKKTQQQQIHSSSISKKQALATFSGLNHSERSKDKDQFGNNNSSDWKTIRIHYQRGTGMKRPNRESALEPLRCARLFCEEEGGPATTARRQDYYRRAVVVRVLLKRWPRPTRPIRFQSLRRKVTVLRTTTGNRNVVIPSEIPLGPSVLKLGPRLVPRRTKIIVSVLVVVVVVVVVCFRRCLDDVESLLPNADVPLRTCPATNTQCLLANMVQLRRLCPPWWWPMLRRIGIFACPRPRSIPMSRRCSWMPCLWPRFRHKNRPSFGFPVAAVPIVTMTTTIRTVP